MDNDEIKKILTEQYEALNEYSKKPNLSAIEVIEISKALNSIANTLKDFY